MPEKITLFFYNNKWYIIILGVLVVVVFVMWKFQPNWSGVVHPNIDAPTTNSTVPNPTLANFNYHFQLKSIFDDKTNFYVGYTYKRPVQEAGIIIGSVDIVNTLTADKKTTSSKQLASFVYNQLKGEVKDLDEEKVKQMVEDLLPQTYVNNVYSNQDTPKVNNNPPPPDSNGQGQDDIGQGGEDTTQNPDTIPPPPPEPPAYIPPGPPVPDRYPAPGDPPRTQ